MPQIISASAKGGSTGGRSVKPFIAAKPLIASTRVPKPGLCAYGPVPAGVEPPVVLDMACSVAARGKIIVAAKEGQAIPADWAVGRDGIATTDAIEALKGFVQPVGGPKGYALTLVIGLLSTMLSGAFFGSEVTHMYDDLERPQNIGHLFAAIPIALFEDIDVYKSRMDKAIAEVRGVKRAAGVDRIFMPGERERIAFAACRRARYLSTSFSITATTAPCARSRKVWSGSGSTGSISC